MSVGPINPYNEFDDKENSVNYPQVNGKSLKNGDLRKVNSMIAAIFEKSPTPSRNLRSMDSNFSSPNWDHKCGELKSSVAALQRDLALRGKNAKNLTEEELTYYRSLLSEVAELPINYQRDFFMFIFKLFEVHLIEDAIRFWSGLAKSEDNFGDIAKILLMPATGLVKACLSCRENEKFSKCDFKPIQLVRDLLRYVDEIPDVLNLLIVLWGKSKPSRALALQMVKFYLKCHNTTADDMSGDIQKKLVSFICRGLSDRDTLISKQAKSLVVHLERRIPQLAAAVKKKTKPHLLPRMSSTCSSHKSAYRSISREIDPRTPELEFTKDIDEAPKVVRSPAELELDFHRELDCVEARINEITKIQKMLSESPQVASDGTPSKLDLDELAAKLRRANKREAIRKRLQQVEAETSASEHGGKMLTVRKSTFVPKSRTPSVDADISMSEGDEEALQRLVEELQQVNETQKAQSEDYVLTVDNNAEVGKYSSLFSLFFTLSFSLIIILLLSTVTPTTRPHEVRALPVCDIIVPETRHYKRQQDFQNLINSNMLFQKSENRRAIQLFQKQVPVRPKGQCEMMSLPFPEPSDDEERHLTIPETLSFWAKFLVRISELRSKLFGKDREV